MEETNQKKKILLTGIIATVILFVVVLIVLIVLMGQDSKNTRILWGNLEYKTKTVDMTNEEGAIYQYKTMEYQGSEVPILLVTPDGTIYYCIETVANLAGYRYNKGTYGALDESTDSCHIDDGGEYVTFSSISDVVSKSFKDAKYTAELSEKNSGTNSADKSLEEELITFENPVIKFVDGKLYASYEAMTQGLNMRIIAEGTNIRFYTLEQLITTYSSFLSSKGYTLTQNFKNRRALNKGLAVAGQNGKYGVLQISGNNYTEVISVKYDTIEYVQSIEEFIISSDSSYGMIAPGEEQPTIALRYDSISLLDAEEKLYIVEIDEKYGVVNTDGDIIVPTEYDQIGLDDVSDYKGQNITNKYLLAGECIPVKSNGRYGLFSKDGYTLAQTMYSTIGCENPSDLIDDTSAMPTLIVPLTEDINCIVFSIKNNTGSDAYGMMTTDGTVVLQAYYTAIYYMTSNGKVTYYFNKLNNNELVTLDELLNTSGTLKNLIQNKSYKKSKAQLEKDTLEQQQNMQEQNNEENADNVNETSSGNNNDNQT